MAAYLSAIRNRNTPTGEIYYHFCSLFVNDGLVMSLTRQNLPQLAQTDVEKALKGGYILGDSEVHISNFPLLTGTKLCLLVLGRILRF